MDKAEIKQIADYLKDLEEGLYERDYQRLTSLGHVTKLHLIIKRLMDGMFQTTDHKLKLLLATLEMRARRCKDCIETRLAVRNYKRMTKRYYKYAETHRAIKGRKQKYYTTCKQWKAESDFRKDRAKRDGLRIRFRDCDDIYEQEYRRQHRKGSKEYLSRMRSSRSTNSGDGDQVSSFSKMLRVEKGDYSS